MYNKLEYMQYDFKQEIWNGPTNQNSIVENYFLFKGCIFCYNVTQTIAWFH